MSLNRLLIRTSAVQTVDDGNAAQLHQVDYGTGEIHSEVPSLGAFGFASNPPPGSDAVTVHMDGDPTRGIIIATGNQKYRLKSLGSGESALYDTAGSVVRLHADGTVEIVAATAVRITSPRLECTGEIVDHCTDGSGKSMAQMRQIYDSHTHGGIQGGSAHTAAPDQQQ